MTKSFFKTIKKEFIYQIKIINREELRNKLLEYIECFIIIKSRHSVLGDLTINEFCDRIWESKKILIAG